MSGQEWRLLAACRDASKRSVARAFGGATAQAGFIREFCTDCPVKADCLEFGVRIDSDGVYGGMTRRERAKAGLVPKASQRVRPERRWNRTVA